MESAQYASKISKIESADFYTIAKFTPPVRKNQRGVDSLRLLQVCICKRIPQLPSTIV